MPDGSRWHLLIWAEAPVRLGAESWSLLVLPNPECFTRTIRCLVGTQISCKADGHLAQGRQHWPADVRPALMSKAHQRSVCRWAQRSSPGAQTAGWPWAGWARWWSSWRPWYGAGGKSSWSPVEPSLWAGSA